MIEIGTLIETGKEGKLGKVKGKRKERGEEEGSHQ